jgi:hypothetical protein
VRFDFISTADGHRYNETYSFSVNGKKDCSAPEEPASEDNGKAGGSDTSSNSSGSSHEEAHAPTPAGDGGPDVPAIPLTIASVSAIGLALLGRRNPAND